MKKTILFVLALVLCRVVEIAKADFTFGKPTNLGPTINSPHSDYPGSFSSDGLEMYFDSNRSGGSWGTDDIWISTRTTTDDAWGEPMNLGPPVNSSGLDICPIISTDGLSLYFISLNRAGGYGSLDTWVATRATVLDPWGEPSNLGPTINTSQDDIATSISCDGLALYFYRQPPPEGPGDIYMSTRPTTNDAWGEPVNLGPTVNSSYNDGSPYIWANGLLLFFFSNRPGGFGDRDLYMTRRATIDDDWGISVNLGPTINTSASDHFPIILPDGSTLCFASSRPGGVGGSDLWQAPILPVVDFNGDAIVDSADMCIMVDHWGENYPLCDIGPTPLGDGIVDVEDLIVLAEHLFEDYRLVAHWALDEDAGNIAYDSTSENDAALQGEPIWQPYGGKVGGALQFDGINDYVSTPFILNPNKGSFSVTAWMKGGGSGQVIISQRDLGRDQGNTWLSADTSYGRLMTRLMHPPFPPLVSESVITDDQWHHVGLVFDFISLHRYLYIDGNEVAKDSDYVGGVGSDGGLTIGVDKTLDAASFFSGLIDDVRIYNNVLSAEEIAALAQ